MQEFDEDRNRVAFGGDGLTMRFDSNDGVRLQPVVVTLALRNLIVQRRGDPAVVIPLHPLLRMILNCRHLAVRILAVLQQGQAKELSDWGVSTMSKHNEPPPAQAPSEEPAYTIKCRYACTNCGELMGAGQKPLNWPHGTTRCNRCGGTHWLKLASPVMAPPPDNSAPLRVSYWSLRLLHGDTTAPYLKGAFDVAVRNTGKVCLRELGQIIKAVGRIVTTTDGKHYELGDVEREYLDTISDDRAREQINGPNPIPQSLVLTKAG